MGPGGFHPGLGGFCPDPGGDPPPVNKQAIRILLERFLVCHCESNFSLTRLPTGLIICT